MLYMASCRPPSDVCYAKLNPTYATRDVDGTDDDDDGRQGRDGRLNRQTEAGRDFDTSFVGKCIITKLAPACS